MKKRAFRSIIVALWLITLLVATGVLAAPATRLLRLAARADPVIRFSPSSSTVAPGATFAIDVVVDNVVDLGGYDFTVTFDPAVVHVQNVTLGLFLGSTGNQVLPLGPNIDNAMGKFTFGGFTMPPNVAPGPSGTGTVAHLTLQAMAVGSSALTFTKAVLTNTQATVLGPLTMAPGSVVVSSAAPTGTPTSGGYWIYLPVLKRAMP